jgi:hypothetical protein
MNYNSYIIYSLIIILIICIYIYYIFSYSREFYTSQPLRAYFNAFWPNTTAIQRGFFLDMLSRVYKTPVIEGNLEESEILIESTFGGSEAKRKQWKHTYLFNGEPDLRDNLDDYTCIFSAEADDFRPNNITLPFFLFYLYQLDMTQSFMAPPTNVPPLPTQDVLVIISNAAGSVRNQFLDELDKHFKVSYAGQYKNNTGGPLTLNYGSKEFCDYVSNYKFIITMENNERHTLITEKIFHGLFAKTVPVYWGSPNIGTYINPKRFIHMKSVNDINATIEKMKEIASSESQWQSMVMEEWKGPHMKDLSNDYYVDKVRKLLGL